MVRGGGGALGAAVEKGGRRRRRRERGTCIKLVSSYFDLIELMIISYQAKLILTHFSFMALLYCFERFIILCEVRVVLTDKSVQQNRFVTE